jgi:hypothetical protein
MLDDKMSAGAPSGRTTFWAWKKGTGLEKGDIINFERPRMVH